MQVGLRLGLQWVGAHGPHVAHPAVQTVTRRTRLYTGQASACAPLNPAVTQAARSSAVLCSSNPPRSLVATVCMPTHKAHINKALDVSLSRPCPSPLPLFLRRWWWCA